MACYELHNVNGADVKEGEIFGKFICRLLLKILLKSHALSYLRKSTGIILMNTYI